MNELDFNPFYLSLKLASITTLILLLVGLPLAWWLVNTKKKYFKSIVETFVTLPVILPPTILGFYLLIILGQSGIIGKYWYILTGWSLAFSFSGLVIGSVLYSLPFVVQPLQTSFQSIGSKPMEVALSLGASKIDYFFSIHLPLARRGIISAMVLGFTHTLGEFGVVLMLGGNIPGSTKVISIAIYDFVEQLEYTKAHYLSGGVLLISFCMLMILFIFNKKG